MIHGINIKKALKIDNKELQAYIDNYMDKELRRWANAGELALQSISDNVISEFYKYARRNHTYTSIPRALKTKKHNFKENKEYAWCDIELYIDEEQYLTETEPYYSIYNWADRHGYPHMYSAKYVIATQWRHGFVGLPSRHYDTGKLKLYMIDEIDRIWGRRTKKFLK